VPGTSAVYPVKKDKVIYHVAGNQDQPVKRFQISLVPARRGLTSTIHVAQGREMFPIIKLDETITPTHVFIAMTRSRRSSTCLIEPSDKFDFSVTVFGKGPPLNPTNELLVAHLRGDEEFEEQLVEYHSSSSEGHEAQGRSQVDLVVAHAGRAERRPQAQASGGRERRPSAQTWRSNAAAGSGAGSQRRGQAQGRA
jgi:hypothetical protein